MKVGKGQSQPEIVAAAFLNLYILGSPFLYHLLIVTHVTNSGEVPSQDIVNSNGIHGVFPYSWWA